MSIPEVVPSAILRFALWNVYAFAAGTVATGLWVIAHECGHRAFSDSNTVNDAVGLVLHSALLVPYHRCVFPPFPPPFLPFFPPPPPPPPD